jgi:hypothetical protein
MNSDFEDNEGFYQNRFLPVRLAERAAKVTDEPRQMTIAAFRSPEALTLCTSAHRDLISARERLQTSTLDKARRSQ